MINKLYLLGMRVDMIHKITFMQKKFRMFQTDEFKIPPKRKTANQVVWRRPKNSFLKTRIRSILNSNLTCFQLVLNGYTIGKQFREKQHMQSGFYSYFYNGIVYINFFWLFHCFKQAITFFIKLGYRQHIFLGGGTFDINKNDPEDRTASLHVNSLKIEELLGTKKYIKTAWLEGVYFIANRI